MDQNVIEKIRKLLTLANGTSEVNEAATAFAQAQTLMTKYRLSMLDLNVPSKEEDLIRSRKPLYSGERAITWKSILANNLAELNNCKLLIFPGPNKEYILFGSPSDIQITEYIFESVSAQIEYLSNKAIKDGLGRGKTFTNNFKMGAVSAVLSRLKEADKKAKSEANSTAMVLVGNQLEKVNNWVNSQFKTRRSAQQVNATYDPSGRRAGKEAGEKISLNRGIAGRSQELKLCLGN